MNTGYGAHKAPAQTRKHSSWQLVLLECNKTVRQTWTNTERHWPHHDHRWPQMSFSTILACGSLELLKTLEETGPDAQAQRTNLAGKNRLLQILILEAAHLIWVMRCE